jgi:quercetin dioxygenase-like cupin family protein
MELDVARSIVLRPDEGEVITDRTERAVLIKAGFDAIAVTETRYEPGERGPDPHIHRRQTDAFYVLEGALDFELGPDRETTRLPAGSFVAAPPNLVHTFRNDGNGRARFLNFHAPSGGFADYLRALRDGEDGSWFDQLDPPPDGGRRLSDGAVLGPGEGEAVDVGGSSIVLKGTGASSDGGFFLSETTVEPGFPGPPAHAHRDLHDLFYVLDGTLTLRNGDETIAAGAGSFACFLPGTVHTFSNPGDAPVHFLNFNTPAGWEDYMRELGAAFAGGGPPTPDEIGRIASRYDFQAMPG